MHAVPNSVAYHAKGTNTMKTTTRYCVLIAGPGREGWRIFICTRMVNAMKRARLLVAHHACRELDHPRPVRA